MLYFFEQLIAFNVNYQTNLAHAYCMTLLFLHCNDNLCKNVEFLLKLKELFVYASSSSFFGGEGGGGGVLFICISNTLKLHYITSFTG